MIEQITTPDGTTLKIGDSIPTPAGPCEIIAFIESAVGDDWVKAKVETWQGVEYMAYQVIGVKNKAEQKELFDD